MAAVYGEPFADGSAIPTIEVCRLASRHVKVALSGDGGDELFGGYTHYRRWLHREQWFGRIPAALRRPTTRALRPVVHPADRHRRLSALVCRDGAAAYGSLLELFSPAEKRQLAGPALAPVLRGYDDHWLFSQHWRGDLDPLTRAQYLDLHTFLVDDILTKVDRAAMSCGLEVRPVLLDHELVELAFSMPAAVRSGPDGLDGKRVLREVLRDRLPPEILARRKSGFGAPLEAWLAASRRSLVQTLATGRLVDEGILTRRECGSLRRV
jgi:asparagine synthase (glutamine-hydrolysing)